AVPGGPFNATVLAIDADRRQEILAAPNAQTKTSSHAVSLSALCALCRHLAAGWPIPFIGNLRRRTRRTRADAPVGRRDKSCRCRRFSSSTFRVCQKRWRRGSAAIAPCASALRYVLNRSPIG